MFVAQTKATIYRAMDDRHAGVCTFRRSRETIHVELFREPASPHPHRKYANLGEVNTAGLAKLVRADVGTTMTHRAGKRLATIRRELWGISFSLGDLTVRLSETDVRTMVTS